MKKIKDIFEYHEKWGIGGGCYCCEYSIIHYGDKMDWPSKGIDCVLHNLNLDDLLINGYLGSDFFCKNITFNETANCFDLDIFKTAFDTIKNNLEEQILYEACQKKYLCMTSFDAVLSHRPTP